MIQVPATCPYCGRSSLQQINENIPNYNLSAYCKKNDCNKHINLWIRNGVVVRVIKEDFDH